MIYVLILYFLPTIMSILLNRHGKKKTFMVNLLTGWTIIGWFIQLITVMFFSW
jgi:hypothetical protein